MPALAHAVPEVSQNQLSRRQARAVRLVRHFREIELGLHLSEMRTQRVETAKLLRVAAAAGDANAYCRLAATMTSLRSDVMRLAEVPSPPRAKDRARRQLLFSECEVLLPEADPASDINPTETEPLNV